MKHWGDHVALEEMNAFDSFDDDMRDQAAPRGVGEDFPRVTHSSAKRRLQDISGRPGS